MILNVLILLSVALSPEQLYTESNQSYEEGQFLQAIEGYEEIVESVPNADVYYNLGNSYFQTKNMGKAVANFRRARFLRPRDQDIEHNLSFVRGYRVDRIGTAPGPIAQSLSSVFHYFSLYEASILTALFFLVGCVLVSLLIVYRMRLLLHLAVVSGVMCAFFFVTWQVWSSEVRSVPAVVVVAEANALSGPGEDYKAILTVHDGTELTIRETRGEYVLIQMPGGIGGWMKQEALESIFR